MKTTFKVLFLGAALCCAALFLCNNNRQRAAAVTPADHEQDLFHELKKSDQTGTRHKRGRMVAGAVSPQAVIEGLKRSSRRTKQLFSAARFICIFPIEPATCTAVCNKPSDAVAAVRMLKQQGCSEIRLLAPVPTDIYDAIVKTAREQDIRINA
jgi:hypothetical protein